MVSPFTWEGIGVRVHTWGTVISVALLATAGCSGGGSEAKATASATATKAVAAPSATVSSAGLNAKWTPKLDKLSASKSTEACQVSGSAECLAAINRILGALPALIEDITAAGGRDVYPQSSAQAEKMVNSADTYVKDECPGDENADVQGSPCFKDASGVTVGLATLATALAADEA
jgi:hypothetical protein